MPVDRVPRRVQSPVKHAQARMLTATASVAASPLRTLAHVAAATRAAEQLDTEITTSSSEGSGVHPNSSEASVCDCDSSDSEGCGCGTSGTSTDVPLAAGYNASAYLDEYEARLECQTRVVVESSNVPCHVSIQTYVNFFWPPSRDPLPMEAEPGFGRRLDRSSHPNQSLPHPLLPPRPRPYPIPNAAVALHMQNAGPIEVIAPGYQHPTRYLPLLQNARQPQGQNPQFNMRLRQLMTSSVTIDWGSEPQGRNWASIDPAIGQRVQCRLISLDPPKWDDWCTGAVTSKHVVESIIGVRVMRYVVWVPSKHQHITYMSCLGQLAVEGGIRPSITAEGAAQMLLRMFCRAYVGLPSIHPHTRMPCTEWWPAAVTTGLGCTQHIAALLPPEGMAKYNLKGPIVATWVLPASELVARTLRRRGDIVIDYIHG